MSSHLVEISETAFRRAIEYLEDALDFHHFSRDTDGNGFWYLNDGSLVAEELVPDDPRGSTAYKVHPKLRDLTGYRIGPLN